MWRLARLLPILLAGLALPRAPARAGDSPLEDPERLAFFLEAAHAGSLLESLRGRDADRATPVPEDVRAAEAAAREAEAKSAARLREAVAGGDAASIRDAKREWEEARAAVVAACEALQRAAAKAAGAAVKAPLGLAALRAALREGEALVAYAVPPASREGTADLLSVPFGAEALALVLTRDAARAVRLGPAKDVEAACAALRWADPREDPTDAFAALVRLVVHPLGLDDRTKVLLVAPDGPLSFVPFAPMCASGGRAVAFVPSAGMLEFLRRDAPKTGEGVLAVGDAAVGPEAPPPSGPVPRLRSVPLPGAREEALAVGDVVLLGEHATEGALRETLAKRPRWRAVHLACASSHDADRPMLSALRLAPSAADDGLLTALDVYRMRIEADLVVLSADRTALGKVVRGEGVVGLVRAFLFAGAPRVIASLSRVDDEATRALMTRFHERWREGRPAAAALAEAQAFVRADPRWRHPSYWAPWVLWGLPD